MLTNDSLLYKVLPIPYTKDVFSTQNEMTDRDSLLPFN